MKIKLLKCALLASVIGCPKCATVAIDKTPTIATTYALQHMRICFDLARSNADQSKIVAEFMESIENVNDDPANDKILEDVARKIGADDSQIVKMWDDYGMTDEGHFFYTRYMQSVAGNPEMYKDHISKLAEAITQAIGTYPECPKR